MYAVAVCDAYEAHVSTSAWLMTIIFLRQNCRHYLDGNFDFQLFIKRMLLTFLIQLNHLVF